MISSKSKSKITSNKQSNKPKWIAKETYLEYDPYSYYETKFFEPDDIEIESDDE